MKHHTAIELVKSAHVTKSKQVNKEPWQVNSKVETWTVKQTQ